VFQHTRGVLRATSGYAGGTADTAHYNIVGSETTTIPNPSMTYDPSKITFGQLSGCSSASRTTRRSSTSGADSRGGRIDRSSSRSAGQRASRAYIEQLDAAKVFRSRIVTDVSAPMPFYPPRIIIRIRHAASGRPLHPNQRRTEA
jgi:peptide-methionine (S)-S-oxide reductase